MTYGHTVSGNLYIPLLIINYLDNFYEFIIFHVPNYLNISDNCFKLYLGDY